MVNLGVASVLLIISIASTVTIEYQNQYRWFYSVSVFVIPFCVGIKGVNETNIFSSDPSYWKTFSLVACVTFLITQVGIGIRAFTKLKEIHHQKTVYSITAALCIANGLVFGVRCYFEGLAMKKADFKAAIGKK